MHIAMDWYLFYLQASILLLVRRLARLTRSELRTWLVRYGAAKYCSVFSLVFNIESGSVSRHEATRDVRCDTYHALPTNAKHRDPRIFTRSRTLAVAMSSKHLECLRGVCPVINGRKYYTAPTASCFYVPITQHVGPGAWAQRHLIGLN